MSKHSVIGAMPNDDGLIPIPDLSDASDQAAFGWLCGGTPQAPYGSAGAAPNSGATGAIIASTTYQSPGAIYSTSTGGTFISSSQGLVQVYGGGGGGAGGGGGGWSWSQHAQALYNQQLLSSLAQQQFLAQQGVPVMSQPNMLTPKLPHVTTLGEIIAWRVWQLKLGKYLQSMAVDKVWEPGKPMIGDPSHIHYGVHAWKTLHDALSYGGGHTSALCVVGRVALWGEVIEHQGGYRAQYAEPVEITDLLQFREGSAMAQTILAKVNELYCKPKPPQV